MIKNYMKAEVFKFRGSDLLSVLNMYNFMERILTEHNAYPDPYEGDTV